MRVAAVDMGATSVRVAVVELEAEAPRLEIVHRWQHGPETCPDGSVRWRWPELLKNVRLGLDHALETGPIASIGIDGWAVDYGLLDEQGRLLSDPHSYRSTRTDGWRAVARSLGEADLYRRTGVQLMPINTIFQLAAHDRTELERAARLLMLPELVAYELTGAAVSERSNAGTTGLLEVATGAWANDLAEAVGVSSSILPVVRPAGQLLGEHRGVPVHLVAAHDTACAVAASPLGPADRGFLSAGTWFLVGIERPAADTSEAARAANFSNEPGAAGGFRFLKNVPGFWLLERCASEWGDTTGRELLDLPGAGDQVGSIFDVRENRFLAPEHMADEVRAAAGLAADAPRAAVVSSIVRSIAANVASVIDELRSIQPLSELAIVGGGAASPVVRRAVEEAAGVRLVAGPPEATALGNALLQGLSLGRFWTLGDARAWAAADMATAG
ncbi:MAG: rhamnulokinase [Actinobacteria bacterium]|nr:rhamnulokinase [Actinomycetota bacterium]